MLAPKCFLIFLNYFFLIFSFSLIIWWCRYPIFPNNNNNNNKLTLWEFFTQALAGGFSLEGEWQQVSSSLFSVFWLDSSCPLISKSSSPFTKSLGIIPSTQIIIGITVTFIFYGHFSSLTRSRYLAFCSLSFIFTLWPAGTVKSSIRPVLFSFLFFFFVDCY